MPTLAIVGGGASAALLLINLAERADLAPETITIFDPAPLIGPGKAYHADSGIALLNQQIKFMSPFRADADHLSNWVVRNTLRKHLADDQFMYRRDYGRYLAEQAGEASTAMRARGVRINHVRREVTGLTYGASECWVHAGDLIERADHLVLAMGGGEPVDAYGLAGSAGFVADPYPLGAKLGAAMRARSVAVIGSGLAALDVVNTLHGHGYRGVIHLASRSGQLPAVRIATDPAPIAAPGLLRRTGPVTVAETMRWFLNTVGRRGGAVPARLTTDLPAGESLRRQLRSTAADTTWQATLLGVVRQHLDPLWNVLTGQERQIFVTRYGAAFTREANPMPRQVAAALLEMMSEGRLHVHGALTSITPGSRYLLGFGGDRGARPKIGIDLVVNTARATGQAYRAPASELTRSLRGNGLADEDGAIRIDPRTGRVRLHGTEPLRNVFAVGDRIHKDVFYISSINSINRLSRRIVDAFARTSESVLSVEG